MSDVEWIMANRSPGLKAITADLLAGTDHPSLDIFTRGTALQALASSSLFVATNSRKANVPLETTTVRRSTRLTKYNGFKINQATDVKQTKTKVRARALPSVLAVSNAAAPAQLVSSTCPPPT